MDHRQPEAYQYMKKQVTVTANSYDKLTKPVLTTLREVERLQAALNHTMNTQESINCGVTQRLLKIGLMLQLLEMQSMMNTNLMEIKWQQNTEMTIIDDLYHGYLCPFLMGNEEIEKLFGLLTLKGKFGIVVRVPGARYQVQLNST